MNKERYKLTHFYGDTLKGTTGVVVKEWKDLHGNEWVKLHIGTTQLGKKIINSYPKNILEKLCHI